MIKDIYRSTASSSLIIALLAACSSRGTLPSQPPATQPETGSVLQATGSAPYHIETWAYDNASAQGSTASPALVSQYVTYAESGGGAKALTDCHTVAPGCKAVLYIDANRVYVGENKTNIMPVAKENWWLHSRGYTDSAHRLRVIIGSHIGYLLNQSSPEVQGFWKSYLRTHDDAYDGLMADDTSAGVSEEFYGTGYTSSQEITTDSQVVSMHQAFAAQLVHNSGRPFYVIQNGVNPNPYLPHGLQMIGNPSNISGLVTEGHPLYGNGRVNSWYPNLLDVMAQVNRTSGFIVLLSYGSGGHASDRYIQTATMWLGYSPGHEVDWENLAGNNDLAAWPEETIYPTQAVQTMSTGNTNLIVANKVWRREFRACYLRGRYWGRCAALVNLNGYSVSVQSSWLTQAYTRTIQVVGGDVQNPGAAVTLGAKQTWIPANGALLLYGI
ncbi:MAG: hypothetical protein ACXWNK_17845 [Vulcanimicrobiaceae bacterium]